MNDVSTIGFVGLGAMGRPMAHNLRAAGFGLKVWNRTPGKADDLIAAGAAEATTLADCVDADLVISMLADEQALDALIDDHGLIDAMRDDGVHVNMATISIDAARRFTKAHQNAGRGYVAAPVLGRPDLAKAAKLNIVAAGPWSHYNRAQPALATLGGRVWPAGDAPFRANVIKLATNFMLVTAVESMCEATSLAGAYDVNAHAFLEIISQSVFAAPAYQGYAPAIESGNFDQPDGFKLGLGAKDLSLAREAAANRGLSLSLAEAAAARMDMALDDNLGDLDLSALARVAPDKSRG